MLSAACQIREGSIRSQFEDEWGFNQQTWEIEALDYFSQHIWTSAKSHIGIKAPQVGYHIDSS
jgi:hypothetical protein